MGKTVISKHRLNNLFNSLRPGSFTQKALVSAHSSKDAIFTENPSVLRHNFTHFSHTKTISLKPRS